jgi:hypothetical protein
MERKVSKSKITLDDIAKRMETNKNAGKAVPIPKLTGAGDPDYIKNMIAAGKARKAAKAKQFAGDNSNVNPVYGPIAGSATE